MFGVLKMNWIASIMFSVAIGLWSLSIKYVNYVIASHMIEMAFDSYFVVKVSMKIV